MIDRRQAAIEAAKGAIAGVRSYSSHPPHDPDDVVAAAVVDAVAPFLTGDEYHSLEELYLYRMLYHAHAANEWARHGTYPVVKSRFHSDGLMCFGGGWFIVVATLPTGQVSNHYKDEHWPLFQVPEVPLPPEYDGHTPQVAAERLRGTLDVPVTNTPHLVGEPIGWVGHVSTTLSLAKIHVTRESAIAQRTRLELDNPRRVFALVPVEDQP